MLLPGVFPALLTGFALAFALVWQLWWLVLLALLFIVGALIVRGFARDTHKTIPAAEVRAEHQRWLATVRSARPILRGLERSSANQGLAAPEPAGA